MNFALKTKQSCHCVSRLMLALSAGVLLFWGLMGTVWTRADFQAIDIFYKYAVRAGKTVPNSEKVVYLSLTNATYRSFGRNLMDRMILSETNLALTEIQPEAVGYDIIFAYPGDPDSTQQFAASLAALNRVYFPFGFDLSDTPAPFTCDGGAACERLKSACVKPPLEIGNSPSFSMTQPLLPLDEFSAAVVNFGHIYVPADADGVHRHIQPIVKVGSCYFPTLALAMFLDYAGVTLDQITIAWGKEIRIPASPDNYLEKDVVIPIDAQGRTFIPFLNVWDSDFYQKTVHNFLADYRTPELKSGVTQSFEGKFALIGDVSQIAKDTGQTPLEDRVPLVAIHAALLNGLLTNHFYRPWSFWETLLFIAAIAALLQLASLPKTAWLTYITGAGILCGLPGFAWFEFTHFVLFPVISVGGSAIVLFVGLLIGLYRATSKEQVYIRAAFARFVPESVVQELIDHPEKLRLGGEKRTLSVLFSDLQGFTTISEKLSPEELVQLLNEYLTEMTTIILAEGGIIDKYEGDAIMAEFGAPLPLADHVDRAVAAALRMQRRLIELREQWAEKRLPELRCRIGINTGEVVVGNMGSDQVFDYTVIGDDVNLASRLEGANKNYQTYLMISEATHRALTSGRFLTRVLDVIKVKGKSNAVKVFEVYGETTETLAPEALTYYHTYQTAFEAYLARDFTQALERFAGALHVRPNDPAAKWMISRIVAINPDELPDDWDGSVVLTSK